MYVVILAAILFVSSSVIYVNFSDRLQHRFESVDEQMQQVPFFSNGFYSYNGTQVALPKPEDVQSDLINALILVNSILLIGAGVLSYWLAGITLMPIQEAYERQRRFLGDASHELRTPLAILQTELENELDTPHLPKASKDRAESHLEEVQKMGSLVGDLLTLSRFDDSATVPLEMYEVDITTLIKGALERLQPIAAKHTVSLHFEQADEKMLFMRTNKEQFLQALNNVIKNAILYNKENGTVTISHSMDSSSLQVKVSDTGMGIPKEDLAKIFDRFYRTDKSRSRQTGGSGLGLSIVQSSMHKLSGTVDILSAVGKGTVVTLIFPFQNAN